MKRIISTLLSLSLVLSLLPTVALAEGESSGLLFEAPDSLTVGESASAVVGDENGYVTEHVTWKFADDSGDSIIKMEEPTDSDLTAWGITDLSGVDRSAIVKITAQQVGEAVIQATTDSGKTGTHTITVTAPVQVESITLKQHELICDSFDKSYQLDYEFNPTEPTNRNVEWKSSNPKVVDVTSTGLVMPKKTGTASITVTALDGSEASDSCKVIVNATRPVEKISLDFTTLDFTEDDESRLLTVYFDPEDTTDKTIIWTSSDESVATVNENGEVFPVNNGNAKITAAVAADTAVKAECRVNVDLTHTHTWSKCWDADKDYHYHVCSKCGGINGTSEEKHDFSNGDTCSVCGMGKNGEKVQLTSVKMKHFRFAYNGSQIDFLGGENCDNIKATATVGKNIIMVLDTPLQGEIQECIPTYMGDETRTEWGKYDATVKFSTGLYEMIALLQFDIVQVTIDENALSFDKVRDSKTLKADVNPEAHATTSKGVTWKSSDETVATVDKDGVVTAMSQDHRHGQRRKRSEGHLQRHCGYSRPQMHVQQEADGQRRHQTLDRVRHVWTPAR